MNTAEIKSLIKQNGYKTIVITGYSATGKTTLAHSIPHYRLYHTDDYIKFGYEDSIYALLEDVKKDDYHFKIIEGIQVNRLLRKGVQLGIFSPDLIIRCNCSPEVRIERYKDRGDADKIQNLNAMDRGLNKVWMDYLCIVNNRPLIVDHEN